MGSRSKVNYAYIAGFLDGDGSLMLQVKKRKDGKQGWRFMPSIVFYQDSRHDKPLYWIRSQLNIGYISRRKDKITELRVNGFRQVEKILKALLPYIRFKKAQAQCLLEAVELLNRRPKGSMNRYERMSLMQCILKIQSHNYQSPKKKTRATLEKVLDLTP